MSDFQPGDRVTIRTEMADHYKQPWANRIKRGLVGTVIGPGNWGGLEVQWDTPSRAKYPSEWLWRTTHPGDLQRVDA